MEKQDPKTYAIIGAAMEVHRQIGCGFLEAVYQEALAIELDGRAIPYQREVELPVFYKAQLLKPCYRVDFICYDIVVVELKALTALGSTEEAQILNYLKAADLKTGLLLNFGAPSLQYKRYIYTPDLRHPKSV